MSDVGGAMTGGAGPGADGDLDMTQDADAGGGSQVICTICMEPDGSFKMYQGDEPDEGGEGAEPAMPPAGAADMAGAAAPGGAAPPSPDAAGPGGAPDEQEADAGESFGTVAELMKAVLETVKSAQDDAGGGEDQNMQAGYDQEAGGAQAA